MGHTGNTSEIVVPRPQIEMMTDRATWSECGARQSSRICEAIPHHFSGAGLVADALWRPLRGIGSCIGRVLRGLNLPY
jgi:hypothetical protein